jgi:ABC-2 type transport system ATP-binding protein
VAQAGYQAVRRGERWEIALADGQTIDPIIDLLRSRGLSLRHLEEKHQTLEDIFMETVVGAEPGLEAPRRRRRSS